jgi:PAS domain S-box-containing protein
MNSANTDGKSDMARSRAPIIPGVFAIVASYALFAGLWILLSDRAMGLLFNASETVVQASMAKGWLFVAVTSLLLYVLVRRFVGRLDAAHQRDLEYQRAQKQAPPMLMAIADASADAIFAKDQEGRYLLLNKAAARVVGKPAQEVLGKDDRALFPPEQAERIMAVTRRVLESGQPENHDEVVQTADGARHFLTIKGPLRGADGSIFGIYGISRDITERKQTDALLHESRERQRLLVEYAPVALAMFDCEMRYLAVNQRWRDHLALGDREVIGHSHYEISPQIPEDWRAAHRRGIAGETVSADEDRWERPNGTVIWVRWAVRPWYASDGTVGGIVIFGEDITERKLADENMKLRNAELEQFNLAATDRELRMIALKREVNDMARAAGRAAPYDTSFADTP